MKKTPKFPTVIALMIAVLITGGCGNENQDDTKQGYDKVTIYLKAIEKDGEMHLEMYDSRDGGKVVEDTLVTYVKPGTEVTWKRVKNSGIKKLIRIGPVKPGIIMPGDAKKVFLTKKFRFEVPEIEIREGTEQKYDIVFVAKEDNEEWTIDPYLRIPFN